MTKSLSVKQQAIIGGFVILRVNAFLSRLDSRLTLGQPFGFG